jgi:hypothetical protein
MHVKGQPEWVFVKVFSHSNRPEDQEAVLGAWGHRLHRHLTEKYNDGKHYTLHYTTAREAFNIAKAAEAGMRGNPNDYRNFSVAPYFTEFFYASLPYQPIAFTQDAVTVRFDAAPGRELTVRMRARGVQVGGSVSVLSIEERPAETVLRLQPLGPGEARFQYTTLIPDGAE